MLSVSPVRDSSAIRRAAAAIHDRVQRAVGRPLFWAATVTVLLAVPLALGLSRDAPVTPPVLGTLPAVALSDQDGRPFTHETARGKVWIADFIFTRCPTVCPRLTERMAKLQKRLRHMGGEVRLVSFSVDPEFDTPARLASYARSAHANPRVWTFVTGRLGAMEHAVVSGFKVAMGRDKAAPDDFLSIFHAERFVLVDRRLRIRGYYDGDDESQDRLIRDAALLAGIRE